MVSFDLILLLTTIHCISVGNSRRLYSNLGPLLSENVSCSGCSSWTSSPKETTPSWPASRRHNALLIKATDSKANSLERLSAILIDQFKRKLLVWCLKYPFQSNGETHNGTKVKIGKGNKKAANLPGRIVNGQYNLIIPLSWFGPAQPDPIFTELAGDIRYHFAHIQAFARSVVSLRRKKKGAIRIHLAGRQFHRSVHSLSSLTLRRDACDGSKINRSCSHKSWANPDVTISSCFHVSCPSASSICQRMVTNISQRGRCGLTKPTSYHVMRNIAPATRST